MKKSILPVSLILFFMFSCGQATTDSADDDAMAALEHNKKFATMYHDLNPDNIDILFTEDYIGHGENGFTWDRERHRGYLSNGNYKVDSIKKQIAEGDWVATWFVRTGAWGDDTVRVPMMHFKHFKDGKIDKLWEYTDWRPEPEE
jgi:hypothetical protein